MCNLYIPTYTTSVFSVSGKKQTGRGTGFIIIYHPSSRTCAWMVSWVKDKVMSYIGKSYGLFRIFMTTYLEFWKNQLKVW